MIEYNEFMNKTVYDWAVVTGSKAKEPNISKTTVNNILEMFQGEPSDACLKVMFYIMRQESRNEIKDKRLSRQLLLHLNELYKNFNNEPNKLENAVRKYLTLFKWVSEWVSKSNIRNVNGLEELLNIIIGGR